MNRYNSNFHYTITLSPEFIVIISLTRWDLSTEHHIIIDHIAEQTQRRMLSKSSIQGLSD